MASHRRILVGPQLDGSPSWDPTSTLVIASHGIRARSSARRCRSSSKTSGHFEFAYRWKTAYASLPSSTSGSTASCADVTSSASRARACEGPQARMPCIAAVRCKAVAIPDMVPLAPSSLGQRGTLSRPARSGRERLLQVGRARADVAHRQDESGHVEEPKLTRLETEWLVAWHYRGERIPSSVLERLEAVGFMNGETLTAAGKRWLQEKGPEARTRMNPRRD